MRGPNLFIIGAPKCGTTAMWQYLSDHPEIYMTRPKEPYFFNHDHQFRNITNWRNYMELYEVAPKSAQHYGEASVWYMYSKVALYEIEKEFPDSRIIVMIRNPVDMFISLHEQLYYNGRESAASPDEAWRLQRRRQLGFNLPKRCIEPSHLQYLNVCSLGTQLRRVYKIIPEDKVLTILFDDLKRDPRAEYLRVLRFLGLSDDGRIEFGPRNSVKSLRFWRGHRMIQAIMRVQKELGFSLHTGVLGYIKRKNTVTRERPPISKNFRGELLYAFEDEMRILEDTLRRDLSAWRRV